MDTPSRDPGWGAVFRRRGQPLDGLTTIRAIFLAMVASHLVLLTVLPSLLPSDGRSPSLLYLGISIVSGL